MCSHVKVKRMDDACDRLHTWHFVPLDQPVAAECGRADTVSSRLVTSVYIVHSGSRG